MTPVWRHFLVELGRIATVIRYDEGHRTLHQAHGYVREAAGAMVAWLRQQGVESVVAYVQPDHQASQNVAHAVGLTATTTVIDGEIRWQG